MSMSDGHPLVATVDSQGRLVLPPEVAARLGLVAGASVTLHEEPNSVRVRRPVEQLAKLYVEPTSRCNLSCRTCIRNAWEEPLGDMSEQTFCHIVEGLASFDARPAVFFGGFGEPLAHPRIVDMIRRVKAIGVPRVELITNGCLLSPEMSEELIEAGIDTLWVSLDGIRPESYSDVRLGALLPEVLENVRRFSETRRALCDCSALPAPHELPERHPARRPAPELGIAFVAMRRNVADLPDLLRTGTILGASRFNVSNVIAYTEELLPQILYEGTLRLSPLPTLWHSFLRLPPMDVTDATREPLRMVVHGRYEASLSEADISGVTRHCPFVEAGIATLTWDGALSPCQALTHTHAEHIGKQYTRQIERYLVGNVAERSLADLWMDAEYVDFRRRVQTFDFAPCITCGGCNLSTRNEEDCEGQDFPRCGACLWSHGLIRCP
jgi:MoaA/NifB/PqqE/SkfB family radical SAM enzyme